jgi:eukaryotic-like serine/threonine-protein kinase
MVNLGAIYSNLGQYDKALAKAREVLRLYQSTKGYGNLAAYYLSLNRLEEARATVGEAQAKQLDSYDLHSMLYSLAFLNSDAAGMEQQVDWATGKSGIEDEALSLEAKTNAFCGRLKAARDFSRRAVDLAMGLEEKDVAASYGTDAALREALVGNAGESRQWAISALGLSTSRDVQYWAALALSLAGDAVRARTLADDLGKQFPDDTLVRFDFLPTLNARLALSRNDAAKAVEILQSAAPYELGEVDLTYPIYVRGEAYLAAHRGSEAAAQFRRILDHRAIVVNQPIGALAHLQLGRAYAMSGDTPKAKAAYQDFLRLWKDADPDIPILKQAKAEYVKLQ